jgi:hypothetical protein
MLFELRHGKLETWRDKDKIDVAKRLMKDAQGQQGPLGPQGPVGPQGPAPAFRILTGTESVNCNETELLVSVMCSSGAPDGAKCAPGATATGLCVRR